MTRAEEEGFIDVLRKAASIGAPLLGKVLNTALPIALGPIGGPVGALAGFALNAAGKLAAESASAESITDVSSVQEGSMERAILAEAALSTIQSMELDPELEESIFSDMKDMVMKALPVVRKAAPHVMGAMMEPALRIALDSLHTYNQKGGAESFEDSAPEPFRPSVHYSNAIDQPADRNAEKFLQNVRTGELPELLNTLHRFRCRVELPDQTLRVYWIFYPALNECIADLEFFYSFATGRC